MGAERLTFDTNILFYAIDNTAGEKNRIASSLLRSAASVNAVLLLQTLAELSNAIRKRPAIPLDYLRRFIRANAMIFPVGESSLADVLLAGSIQQVHKIQFWDAMLVATAQRAGCTILFSEDMQHGRVFDGLTVLNPFLLAAEELERALA